MLIAQLGHITEIAATDWLKPNARSPNRDDSTAWIGEVLNEPHTRQALDNLLAALREGAVGHAKVPWAMRRIRPLTFLVVRPIGELAIFAITVHVMLRSRPTISKFGKAGLEDVRGQVGALAALGHNGGTVAGPPSLGGGLGGACMQSVKDGLAACLDEALELRDSQP